MASAEVQRSWTGSDGRILLQQSIAFMRALDAAAQVATQRPLQKQRILDFGCGWGRLLRLALYYTDPQNLFGCDPWGRSIEECRRCSVLGRIELSEYLPESLPFNSQFDVIYAFSVFTHLSPRATRTSLGTLRKYISPSGMLCITIRPIEYWQQNHIENDLSNRMMHSHRTTGFAFSPHNREAIDGDITYGDSSIDERFFLDLPCWSLVGFDRNLCDPMQVIVYLRPI